MKYLIGAATMLLIISLCLNAFLIGKANQCVLIPNNAAIKPIDLK